MDSGMKAWVKGLLRNGKRPELEIVDEPDIDDWKDRELFWCEYFKSLGYVLFNKRSRNGLTYANSKTFRAGRIPWNKGLKFGNKKDLPF